MILVGNQRGGASELAVHLLKPENEHIDVHEIRGFASDDLREALQEAQALSRATRCKQFLFSMSFNPPPDKRAGIEAFESAIERAEERLGLTDQPRAIVFHEKEGRRHAHCVWSRIDADELKAVQLSFSKRKMQELSRELYLEHGWQMPRGLTNSAERDPRNFTLEEWQQAKRTDRDPREIKCAIQDAWATSDTPAALTHALQERGFKLARGDRRGFVAVDYQGEVYSLPKWAGVKTKDVRQRLGDETKLPELNEVKQNIAAEMLGRLDAFETSLTERQRQAAHAFEERKQALVERQRAERAAAFAKIAGREAEEIKRRQSRFSTGLRGVWDKLRGENARIRKDNECEAHSCWMRDRAEKDALIVRQLEDRRTIERGALANRSELVQQQSAVHQDKRQYATMKAEARLAFKERRQEQQRRTRTRNRSPGPER